MIEMMPLSMPAERAISPDLARFKNVLVLGNPHERYEEVCNFHYERLLVTQDRHGCEVGYSNTASTLEENMKLLVDAGPETIFFVVGGDGTASMILNAAYELGLENPFVIMNGGNAINQWRMHHSDRYTYRPDRILKNGKIVKEHPLEVLAKFPNRAKRRYRAFAYSTRNLTGEVAMQVNSDDYREATEDVSALKRTQKEIAMTLEARKNVVPMIVRELGKPPREAVDISFVLGKLMAKFLRFPSNLFEKECSYVELADNRYRTIGRTALMHALPSRLRGIRIPFVRHEYLYEGQKRTLKLERIDGGPIVAQEDGEHHEDPSGTLYQFSLAPRSVNVVVSRRRAA